MDIGYALVSSDERDSANQHDILKQLGVTAERIFVDHGLFHRDEYQPRLREAMTACKAGDTLVVPSLKRLAHSLTEAQTIVSCLHRQHVSISLGGATYAPTSQAGMLLVDLLGATADFETSVDQLAAPARDVTSGPGPRHHSRKPTPLTPAQQRRLLKLATTGEHTSGELAQIFGVSRATIYNSLRHAPPLDLNERLTLADLAALFAPRAYSSPQAASRRCAPNLSQRGSPDHSRPSSNR